MSRQYIKILILIVFTLFPAGWIVVCQSSHLAGKLIRRSLKKLFGLPTVKPKIIRYITSVKFIPVSRFEHYRPAGYVRYSDIPKRRFKNKSIELNTLKVHGKY